MYLYLKEIQMENFKSFGKKLTVPFFPGFTAITGPNGSGKSNIIDAIQFVLGPKSSKVMRAGRLTDLIFNGGKKQKNPSKYCKVSLVFDNTQRKMPVDNDEVVLTRMIKRAPLKNDPNNYYSYFYINNKAASFSEFQDVQNRARISGDGYNIVKQGDITNLVEMGSVERRRIIDDIAGISTFDNDIKKAEKEQNDVEQNLERIKIILNEINSQLRQLKNDRDEAYRYKELKDKLYETKAKISYKKKLEIQTQITEINQQLQTYEQERNKLETKRNDLKTQYATLMQQLEDIETKIADVGGDETQGIKEKITTLRTEEIKTEEKINYLNDEILELKKEQEQYTNTLEGIQQELIDLQNQHDILSTQITEKQNSYTEKENILNTLKNQIAESDDTSMTITKELVQMREQYNETQNTIHEQKLKRDRLTDKIDVLDTQIAELQETKNTYEFELKDIDWQTTETQKDHQNKQKQLKTIEKQLIEKKKQESETTEQLNDLNHIILKLQRQQAKLQAQYEAVQSIHSKYNQAVNAILKARDTGELKGVHGTIAELANVEKKYETSLEIAAGMRLQSIVVENDEAAAHAIQYLNKHKLGRATFLPLNKMILGKPRGKALMAVKDEHAHGFAIDLVQFNEKYQGAFWYVFGDTIIVNNLTDARRLMGGVRLVDLKGNLIEASGAMIGGSPPKIHIQFGQTDQNELKKITEELESTIKHQDTLQNQLTTLKQELSELEQTHHALQTQLQQNTNHKDINIRKKEYTNKLNTIIKDLENKTTEKQNLQTILNTINNTITELEQQQQDLNTQKETKGKQLLKTTKKEQAQQLRTLEKEYNELQEQLIQQKSEKETISKKIELIEERKNELTQKITDAKQQIDENKDQIKELKNQRATFQNELKALMNIEEQMSDKIKEYATKRDGTYKKTVTIEHDIDKINTRLESYLDLISRAKYRFPTLEDTIKELDQEIALYNIDMEDKKLPNVEALKETLKTIEENMKELEPVNMRALEEYDHQHERKRKFDEDVKHLKDQRKNLEKLVEEITNKKTTRFFEIYDDINKNFKEVYAQLSEEGEAELLLEDKQNLFESGLTIKARPHGKKVLRLDALSGGEKSIASLAFIFAIQQYDPSPFYVLDEIDMFLDGVNAETVSRMIKNKSQHSQFINVSLRKIVLKEAKHIYGVTMHDTGISEMIGNVNPELVGPKGEILHT